jgi:diguanylate cyclase (GGDEF)-like protein
MFSVEGVTRARRLAAAAEAVLAAASLVVVALQPESVPHDAIALLGLGCLAGGALLLWFGDAHRHRRLDIALCAGAALCLVGLNGGAHSALAVLWLGAVACGALARGGHTALLLILTQAAALVVPLVVNGNVDVDAIGLIVSFAAVAVVCPRIAQDLEDALSRAQHEASHDNLTGALTRTAFRQRFEEAAAAATSDNGLWLVLLDLDDFGRVNKTDGQMMGDKVLTEVVRRMRTVIRDTDALGRLGGDEFGLMLKADDPLPLARRLVECIAETPVLGHRVGASVGVAHVPRHGTALDSVLRAADVSVRAAKNEGKGRVIVFEGTQVGGDDHELRRASVSGIWERGLIEMFVQPIVHVDGRHVHAYEALARVKDSENPSPAYWLGLAEQVGLRPELELACLQAALELYPQRPAGTRLTVNVSPAALSRSDTQALLLAVGDLSDLVLELTEEAVIRDIESLKDDVAQLLERGVQIAVDDIGAGHSGLARIMALRPRYVKVDRSLIEGIEADETKTALLDALVGYAARTGSHLVAEGVERAEELEVLARLRVELVQGYHLAPPAPPWPWVAAPAATTMRDQVQIDVDAVTRVAAETTVDELQARFSAQPQLTAAVVEDRGHGGRVAGLVTRNEMSVRLGSQYGYALFARRSVLSLADLRPLTVPPGTAREEIARRAMGRPLATRFDPVLVVDSEGHLCGVVTIPELVTAPPYPDADDLGMATAST